MNTRLPSCKITGAILLALVLFMFALVNAPKAEAAGPDRAPMRACLSDEGESAFPCVWLATVMGNGQGHSFRIYRDGRVKQITHRRAFELLGDCDSNGPLYCRIMVSDRYGEWSLPNGDHGQYVTGGWS